MRKKKDVVMLLIIIGIAIISSGFLYVSGTTFASSDLTVLSISKPNIQSADEDLRNYNWLVNAVLDGGSNVIYGKIDSERFVTASGLTALRDFELRGEISDQEVKYPILNPAPGSSQIVQFTIYDSGWESIFLPQPECPSEPNAVKTWRREIFDIPSGKRTICVYEVVRGFVGRFDSPQVSTEIELEITNGVETKKKTLDTAGTTTVKFDDIAQITWVGDLVRAFPPEPSNYRPVYLSANNKWFVKRADHYDSFVSAKTRMESFLDAWESDQSIETMSRQYITSSSQYNDFLDEYNDLVSYWSEDIIQDKHGYKLNQQSIIRDGENLYVKGVSDARFMNPQLQILIRADFLGIKIEAVKPVITYLKSNWEFNSGDYGSITFTVSNPSIYPTSFAGTLNCGFQKYNTQKYSFGAFEEKTMVIPVDTSQISSGNCVLSVYNVNNPSLKEERQIHISIKEPKECQIEGDEESDGYIIKVCRDGHWVVVATCPQGTEFVDGHWRCKEETPSDGGDGWYDGNETFQCYDGKWWTVDVVEDERLLGIFKTGEKCSYVPFWIYYGSYIIGLLVAVPFTLLSIVRRKSDKHKVIPALMIGIGFGLLAGYVLDIVAKYWIIGVLAGLGGLVALFWFLGAGGTLALLLAIIGRR